MINTFSEYAGVFMLLETNIGGGLGGPEGPSGEKAPGGKGGEV